jgi:WD40 repeat protein
MTKVRASAARHDKLKHVLHASLHIILAILLPVLLHAQAPQHPNYEDDVKPIFARRCFACHNAAEMRSGLNVETFGGVLKGGSSGDVVIAGRASASVLYRALMREDGAPQMPYGQAKLPDAEIAVVRDWIQQGLLENATSKPRGPVAPSLEFTPSARNRPPGAPAMPLSPKTVTLPEPAHAHPVTALSASPWAPLVAVAGHERIYLYDIAKNAPAGELAFPEGIPYVLRFSRDGAILLAAGGRGAQSGKAVLFDVRTGDRISVLGEERDVVLAADVIADGKLVALGGPGKVVKVYSVADGKLLYQLTKHTDWITAIEFSPDGSRLATADRAGGIFLWESANGGTMGNLEEHKDSVTSLSWRGDSMLLSSASEDGSIVIWNAADGFPLASIAKAHTPKPAPGGYGTPPGGVLSVAFSYDGRLVSVGRDSTIRVWGVDGKPMGASSAFNSLLTKVAASSDGKLVVAGDALGRVYVWDGKQSRTLAPSTASK